MTILPSSRRQSETIDKCKTIERKQAFGQEKKERKQDLGQERKKRKQDHDQETASFYILLFFLF